MSNRRSTRHDNHRNAESDAAVIYEAEIPASAILVAPFADQDDNGDLPDAEENVEEVAEMMDICTFIIYLCL